MLITKINIMTKFIDCSNEAKEEKKETMFTHYLCSSKGWITPKCQTDYFDIVKYLGKCQVDGDIFACYKSETISIYKGIKGSEFDN